jgi:glycerol kinase
VASAIVRHDRRTTERVEGLSDRAAEIRETTGLEPDPYFSATKLEWLLDREDRRARAERGELLAGTVDAWLLYSLAGEHVTDVTNAARTMLFDIEALAWDDDLLREFGVPRACLPEVRPSVARHGTTKVDGVDVPVAGVLGDQQAALFGQTCFAAGETKSTYGTGAFLLQNTGTAPVESDNGLLTTVAFRRAGEPARYALEGSVFSAGAAVEWFDGVGLVDTAEMESLARSVDSTNGVYVVPAFSGLGAPHWDSRARGTVLGLTRGTERAHIARAVLEGIAHRTRDVTDAMAADSGHPVGTLRVDGGATSNDLLCQLHADLLDAAVVRPAVEETTALGAASAAGPGVGHWEDFDTLRENDWADHRFDPREVEDREHRRDRWSEAVERARGWAREPVQQG